MSYPFSKQFLSFLNTFLLKKIHNLPTQPLTTTFFSEYIVLFYFTFSKKFVLTRFKKFYHFLF